MIKYRPMASGNSTYCTIAGRKFPPCDFWPVNTGQNRSVSFTHSFFQKSIFWVPTSYQEIWRHRGYCDDCNTLDFCSHGAYKSSWLVKGPIFPSVQWVLWTRWSSIVKVKLLSHVRLFVTSWTRLLCPWNFPGKGTGVGCHFLLQGDLPKPSLFINFLKLKVGIEIINHSWKSLIFLKNLLNFSDYKSIFSPCKTLTMTGNVSCSKWNPPLQIPPVTKGKIKVVAVFK